MRASSSTTSTLTCWPSTCACRVPSIRFRGCSFSFAVVRGWYYTADPPPDRLQTDRVTTVYSRELHLLRANPGIPQRRGVGLAASDDAGRAGHRHADARERRGQLFALLPLR